ncbi:class I adenylate-forming enzyme family protein [candidate division CSSED10-310 bacterium]|uniref:Class I adenylate-forming enzyme family protein n=1 Tax=candidate division CSSED10-310 bacterium TaxID=2855610 RepID=A0ABV6Z5S1_UNCC1
MQLSQCKNFSEVITYHSVVNPNRIFIFDVSSQRTYSYQTFNLTVTKTANFLISQGVQSGDRITAVISNSPEYCFFYFASLRLGAVFNPIPMAAHKEEINKYIKLVEPSLVVIDQQRQAEFEQTERNFYFVPVGKERLFEQSIRTMPDKLPHPIEINEEKPACLYYSSGTTNEPKGVLFSHKNMISNISSICRAFRFNPDNEIHLVFLPLGHTASINYSLLPCAYRGGKIILAVDFWRVRTKIWKLIEEHRVTYMETVPTILYSLLNIYRKKIDHDISSMNFVGCGSAPLQKSIQGEFQERFHLKVANLYGLSETGPSHIDYPLEPGWEHGSIGFPLDVNEVKIVGDDGQPLKTNETGEIVIKGDNVFVGYFKNETLYQEVVKDGYFYSGDLGYKDDQGMFHFVERKKDLIIKGGINIVPGEIDEILMQVPAVKEAVTIGCPNTLFGEDIKSFVVLKDGMTGSSEQIIKFCGQFLPPYKIPTEIEIVESIPKTYSGKLLRKKLREQHAK